MEIGEKIKKLRVEKKLSQKELASRIGVTQTNIAYFETRGNAITLENIFKIATALEVSIKSLLFDDIDYTDVPNSKEVDNLLIEQKKEIEDLRNKNSINEKLLKDTINNTFNNLFAQCVFGFAMQTVGFSQNDLDFIKKPPELKAVDVDVIIEGKAIILQKLVKKDLLDGNIKSEYEPLIFNFFVWFMGNDLDYFFEKNYIENKMYYNMYKYYKETIKPKFGM